MHNKNNIPFKTKFTVNKMKNKTEMCEKNNCLYIYTSRKRNIRP